MIEVRPEYRIEFRYGDVYVGMLKEPVGRKMATEAQIECIKRQKKIHICKGVKLEQITRGAASVIIGYSMETDQPFKVKKTVF